ncbi:transcriptional regulator [Novosphingobium sp. UBA1939]|uniref:transcriptional regulator n=1 Tax=Novosphingobium sp. UBA1939 TaxID=1946982 RepID=UPI0025D60B02|nr:YdaS family helix-turn-helix protein [Novosphingobium sp. UBA1939]
MVINPTPYEALQWALEIAGSQSALARKIGLSQAAVWKWVQSSKRVPAEFVLRVEAATGVPRHHLRPDIYPADLGPSPDWPAGHGHERAAAVVPLHQPHTPNRSAAA